MNNNSIGVFDSGLGGLTAVKEIMSRLPNESIVYFGDTGRVPYGTRSDETIIKYARSDIRFLESHNVKVIVIACGTASSVALETVKNEFKTPIIGVVDATAQAAVSATKNGRIGIIGTPGTIKSRSYEMCIKKLMPDAETFARACPLFVPLVENGHFDTAVARLVVEEYLADVNAFGADTLILGCTHYPLLRGIISEYMGEGVALIDAGTEVAKELEKHLKANDACAEETLAPEYSYYVSDNEQGFGELGGIFLQSKINCRVKKIDIEQY